MKKIEIEIDSGSGFCFGVTTAIKKAEEVLSSVLQTPPLQGRSGGVSSSPTTHHPSPILHCLGDIVHNSKEVERLHECGLVTINHEQLAELHDAKVLLRAHGEPPSTYEIARRNNIEIIDATCPVVLQLQRRIKRQYDSSPEAQIVIFGKNGHAEVLGLVGQTDGHAVVVENLNDVKQLDFSRDIYLYSQTTKNLDEFHEIIAFIQSHIAPEATFRSFDTICRHVANRMPAIAAFAERHDLILFVSGRKSSNGRVLFNECLRVNANSHHIESPAEINLAWLDGVRTIGICGATSTPKWLMEQCRDYILARIND
ncbi:MAG: 4-hydroxy-3-methylbut-2-enyl diphosphate reductase [Prevotella sp.]|nr:4-hydroxy-3-methylbut-2-enyl diphosphate reductase [Prevotella sp.]